MTYVPAPRTINASPERAFAQARVDEFMAVHGKEPQDYDLFERSLVWFDTEATPLTTRFGTTFDSALSRGMFRSDMSEILDIDFDSSTVADHED